MDATASYQQLRSPGERASHLMLRDGADGRSGRLQRRLSNDARSFFGADLPFYFQCALKRLKRMQLRGYLLAFHCVFVGSGDSRQAYAQGSRNDAFLSASTSLIGMPTYRETLATKIAGSSIAHLI